MKGGKAAKKKVGSTINKKANEGGKQVWYSVRANSNAIVGQCYLMLPGLVGQWEEVLSDVEPMQASQ